MAQWASRIWLKMSPLSLAMKGHIGQVIDSLSIQSNLLHEGGHCLFSSVRSPTSADAAGSSCDEGGGEFDLLMIILTTWFVVLDVCLLPIDVVLSKTKNMSNFNEMTGKHKKKHGNAMYACFRGSRMAVRRVLTSLCCGDPSSCFMMIWTTWCDGLEPFCSTVSVPKERFMNHALEEALTTTQTCSAQKLASTHRSHPFLVCADRITDRSYQSTSYLYPPDFASWLLCPINICTSSRNRFESTN